MPSNHLILCHPFSFCPQSFPASGFFPMSQLLSSGGPSIGASVSALVLAMSMQMLVSFRIDWFNLEVQGILESLLQHHNLKASVLQCSAFLMLVQLSHTYMTTGKTIALTIRIIINKVMSLLFNMLSRFIIAFLPRNNRLLISWLQSFSAVTNCHIISHTISRREECVEKDK